MHRTIRTSIIGAIVLCGVAAMGRAQSVVDPNLRVQTWVKGLESPTGLAFLGDSGDALVTEKNTGRVKLVRNRAVVSTVLDLPVANDSERGLLSIALSPSFATDNYVYLYSTASTADGGQAFDNRVDRYVWNGAALALDRHIVRMPSLPGPNHNGGKMVFGPDNKLYTITGDLNRNGLTANFQSSGELTRSAAVLRLQPYGKPVSNNPFYNPASPRSPINDIYAYGIRNSFGLDFDPVSGFLWDSENGASSFDELNLIRPGFNSGWEDIMGPTGRTGQSTAGLVSLGAAAHYVDPRFSWVNPVAPTDVHFLRNSHLGLDYKSDMFVGTARTGAILHFDLSFSRKSLALTGGLADTVADNTSGARLAEQDAIIFGTGFGTVTDIVTGPGGMYVLSLDGNLYRISRDPMSGIMFAQLAEISGPVAVPEPLGVPVLIVCCAAAWSLKRPRKGAGASHPRAARSA